MAKIEIGNFADWLIAQTYPKEAMKNTMAPVTIKMIGGAWNRPSKKWLNSFMSARTSAPAINIPNPDNCAIKMKNPIAFNNSQKFPAVIWNSIFFKFIPFPRRNIVGTFTENGSVAQSELIVRLTLP